MDTTQELYHTIETIKEELARMKMYIVNLKPPTPDFHREQDIPLGAIMAFATQKAPEGWLACDGEMYRTEAFPRLHEAIGSQYNLQDTPNGFFCVPDLQGLFVRGWDKEGNVDPERNLGSYQEDAFQGHAHKIKFEEELMTDYAGGHRHNNYYHTHKVSDAGGLRSTYSVWEVSWGSSDDKYYSGTGMTFEGEHNHNIDISINENTREIVNSSFGIARVSTETRPKNVALLYCIKAK